MNVKIKKTSVLISLCFIIVSSLWAQKMPPMPKCTPVVDESMGDTCYKCKEPAPATICGPGPTYSCNRPSLNLPVAAYQCFIIDGAPECCNYCPSQWLDSCKLQDATKTPAQELKSEF